MAYKSSLHEQPLMLWKVLPGGKQGESEPIGSPGSRSEVETQQRMSGDPFLEYEFGTESESEESDFIPEMDGGDAGSDAGSDSDTHSDLSDEADGVDVFEREKPDGLVENEDDDDSVGALWPSKQSRLAWLRNFNRRNHEHMTRYGCPVDTDADPDVYARVHGTRRKPCSHSGVGLAFWMAVVLASYALQWWIVQRHLQGEVVYLPAHQTPGKILVADEANMALKYCLEGTKLVILHRENSTAVSQATQACSLAVKSSHSAYWRVRALTQRGDLNSVLKNQALALEDYGEALKLSYEKAEREIIHQKYLRLHWFYLYASKDLEKLYENCLIVRSETGDRQLQDEASSWLNLLRGEGDLRPLILTLQLSTMTPLDAKLERPI